MRNVATLLTALICACAPASTSAAVDAPGPPPCIGNDTVYTLASMDTISSFRRPTAHAVILPPRSFRDSAEVWVLVDAHGRVVADSVKIIGAASTKDSMSLASTMPGFRFRPATLHGCAVRAWVAWRVRGPS
ncbi:MAG: hypothetical protein WBC97_09485 [Gemmatimonadales bacterium]